MLEAPIFITTRASEVLLDALLFIDDIKGPYTRIAAYEEVGENSVKLRFKVEQNEEMGEYDKLYYSGSHVFVMNEAVYSILCGFITKLDYNGEKFVFKSRDVMDSNMWNDLQEECGISGNYAHFLT